MKVYILYFSCKTLTDIIGVYSSKEIAEEKGKAFRNAYLTGSSGAQLMIIEREVDEAT
jgi:hypothetical protein